MISGLVPFEEIVESVKDETGIQNIRPYYDRIRRFIFRAEREIGYGGAISLKKLTVVGADKYIQFPPDFIELEGIGQDCSRMCTSSYNVTPEGIRFKEVPTKDIVILYWAVLCDGYGNPMTTRNHQDAVTCFIIWKLYSSKVFLGIGNMNANQNYKNEYITAVGVARGDDAFPTLEEWNEIAILSYSDRRALIRYPTASYNYCTDIIDEDCETLDPGESMKVYYWQLDNLAQTMDDVIDLLSDNDYLPTKPSVDYTVFQNGIIVDYTNISKIAFAIKETENMTLVISDSLNNDITDAFDIDYNAETKTLLYVSKNSYSYSSIYFKFKKVINNV